MNTKEINIYIRPVSEKEALLAKETVREAWRDAGVITDDALFTEVYVSATESLRKALEILPEQNVADLPKMKITIALQALAEKGEFSPDSIEEKSEAILTECLEKFPRLSESLALLAELNHKHLARVILKSSEAEEESKLSDAQIQAIDTLSGFLAF